MNARSSIRRWRAAGAVLPLALLAGGCATGSSASFTMAPLFFSEAADPSGEIVADSGDVPDAPIARDVSLASDMPAGPVQLSYIAASGNAVLPVNAIAPGSAMPIAVLNTAGLVSTTALLALPGSVSGIVGALGPVGIGATLAGGTAVLANGLAATTATVANTATSATLALNRAAGAATSAVTNVTATTVATVAAAVPAVTAPTVAAVAAPVASVAAALPATAVAVAAPVASVAAALPAAVVAVAAPVASIAVAAPAPAVAAIAPKVTTIATMPVAVTAAAPAALIPAATKLLVTAQPVIPAATVAAPAAPAGMLASSVTSLVQMCLMSGCK